MIPYRECNDGVQSIHETTQLHHQITEPVTRRYNLEEARCMHVSSVPSTTWHILTLFLDCPDLHVEGSHWVWTSQMHSSGSGTEVKTGDFLVSLNREHLPVPSRLNYKGT
jgi:hypothetical protein